METAGNFVFARGREWPDLETALCEVGFAVVVANTAEGTVADALKQGTDTAAVVRALEESGPPEQPLDHFYTKVGNKLRRVEAKDIRYIEVEGKYSAVATADRRYNVKASLKELLDKLPVGEFVRVSRNHVVNLARVEHIDLLQYAVRVGDRELPVSRTYKENLMRYVRLL
jgi:DNA-binding LytR/AlgR family response regulator